MKEKRLEPFAPVLLESMRAVGYSHESAVADLIDNSITAGASRVELLFAAGRPEHFALLDDGVGMTSDELLVAMRHGSRSPNEIRHQDDLGRFGLGLKTASMSQCRRLTVVSKKNSVVSAMVWDLDLVAKHRDWVAGILDADEISATPHVSSLLKTSSGTLVVWSDLDRLAGDDSGDGSVLSERVALIRQHISLVFHRFLSSEPGERRIGILINGNPIVPVDPFLLENRATQKHPNETLHIEGSRVEVRAFTLPHISKLSRTDIERAGGEQGLRRQQGFYVYRNRRLIVWGTWFRMFRQEELTKLTRVQVDIPNSLDHLWTLDIKKSTASPPEVIRERLKTLIPTMCQNSKVVQAYRGKVRNVADHRPIWKRIEDREGIRYDIDELHPVVASVLAGSDDSAVRAVRILLRAFSDSLPIEAIYNDRANDRIGHKATEAEQARQAPILEELARQMLEALRGFRDEQRNLLDSLPKLEPFILHPELTRQIVERLQDAND